MTNLDKYFNSASFFVNFCQALDLCGRFLG